MISAHSIAALYDTSTGKGSFKFAYSITHLWIWLHLTHRCLSRCHGWLTSRPPEKCDCGHQFTIEHTLSCSMGGFQLLRHNKFRDITAALCSEICSCATVKPLFQPISGEQLPVTSANAQDEARLDVAMNGLWGGREGGMRKVSLTSVFNPFAPSNCQTNFSTCYHKHENEKKGSMSRGY